MSAAASCRSPICGSRFGMAATRPTADTRIVVLEIEIDGEPMLVGVIADKVHEVTDIAADGQPKAPRVGMRWRRNSSAASASWNNEFVIVPGHGSHSELTASRRIQGLEVNMRFTSQEPSSPPPSSWSSISRWHLERRRLHQLRPDDKLDRVVATASVWNRRQLIALTAKDARDEQAACWRQPRRTARSHRQVLQERREPAAQAAGRPGRRAPRAGKPARDAVDTSSGRCDDRRRPDAAWP